MRKKVLKGRKDRTEIRLAHLYLFFLVLGKSVILIVLFVSPVYFHITSNFQIIESRRAYSFFFC